MPDDVFMFWFIHLALGVVLPILAVTGCCRREEEQQMKEKQPVVKHNTQ
jgi:hypothetical protein